MQKRGSCRNAPSAWKRYRNLVKSQGNVEWPCRWIHSPITLLWSANCLSAFNSACARWASLLVLAVQNWVGAPLPPSRFAAVRDFPRLPTRCACAALANCTASRPALDCKARWRQRPLLLSPSIRLRAATPPRRFSRAAALTPLFQRCRAWLEFATSSLSRASTEWGCSSQSSC